ncbi:hypothetical protein ES705_19958 [subsurface metagenome]
MSKMKFLCTISFLLVLSSLFFSTSLVYGEEMDDYVISYIASHKDDVYVDGFFNEWASVGEVLLEMYEFTYDSAISDYNLNSLVLTLNVTVQFVYNDTYLSGAIFMPDDFGRVDAMDLFFFGIPGDDNDGMHIDAVTDDYMDMAYPAFDENVTEGPHDDYNQGGTNNMVAHSVISGDGTYFEFAKEIRSGDTLGHDIYLNYGNSIAVTMVAWVGISTYESGPNFGSMCENGFNFIRLSIGQDMGDYLELPFKDKEGFMPTILSSGFEAPYMEAVEVVYDGYDTESFWSDATSYSILLKYVDFDTGYFDESSFHDGKLRIIQDSVNIYFYFETYDETDTDDDMLIFAFGKDENIMDDPNGVDLFMLSSYGVMDYVFKPAEGDEPIPDTSIGGTDNGNGTWTYDSDDHKRCVEFYRPLTEADEIGGEYYYNLGDTLYMSILAGYDSNEGPNFIDMEVVSDSKGDYAALAVHPIKLLMEGEEPKENTDEDKDTISLGFEFTDLFLITVALVPVVTLAYRRKKRS